MYNEMQLGGMVIFISLLVSLAWAIGCAAIANNKGYNPLLAGVLGFFLQLFAVIWYVILPDKSHLTEIDKLGPRRRQQAEFEALLPDGACRVCHYVNGRGAQRCEQCGNIM